MTDCPMVTQEMINLYDEYTHITLDRRAYLSKLTALVGSSAGVLGARIGEQLVARARLVQ